MLQKIKDWLTKSKENEALKEEIEKERKLNGDLAWKNDNLGMQLADLKDDYEEAIESKAASPIIYYTKKEREALKFTKADTKEIEIFCSDNRKGVNLLKKLLLYKINYLTELYVNTGKEEYNSLNKAYRDVFKFFCKTNKVKDFDDNVKGEK